MERVFRSTVIDENLRNFMLNMFNHTWVGLLVSAIVSYFVYQSGLMVVLTSGILGWIVLLAPLAMILVFAFKGQNWSKETITIFYYTFVALMGISLSTIFVTFSPFAIIQAFLVTSATFAAASLYGYLTKKDLTAFGTFLIVGLIGILIASIVNVFVGSGALTFAISVLGVIIFTGLTAYDVQTAKNIFLSYPPKEAEKYGVVFALSLYLNFVNLFQMFISLFSSSSE